MKIKKLLLLLLLSLGFIGSANATTLCLDGSYVAGSMCQLCPDGSYVDGSYGSGGCRLTPSGTYIPGGGDMKLCPDGSYVNGRCNICPDGSYSGGSCILMPDGSYGNTDRISNSNSYQSTTISSDGSNNEGGSIADYFRAVVEYNALVSGTNKSSKPNIKQTPKTQFNRPKNSNPYWQMLGENTSATAYFYIDLETINIDDNGFAYFWSLANLYEPKSNGINSIEVYVKTNCNTNQIMVLKENQYKQEMAEGSHQSIELKPQWLSLPSDSIQHWASERTCWWLELNTE